LVLGFRAQKFSRSATSESTTVDQLPTQSFFFKNLFYTFLHGFPRGDRKPILEDDDDSDAIIIMSDVSKETLKKEIAGNYNCAPPPLSTV